MFGGSYKFRAWESFPLLVLLRGKRRNLWCPDLSWPPTCKAGAHTIEPFLWPHLDSLENASLVFFPPLSVPGVDTILIFHAFFREFSMADLCPIRFIVHSEHRTRSPSLQKCTVAKKTLFREPGQALFIGP